MKLTEDALRIEELVGKILLLERPNDHHFEAVQAQCASADEV